MGRWIPLAGGRGGTVPALVLSPSFPEDQLAFAATHTGLFRSRNGGKSWELCGEGLGSFAVPTVVFSPHFEADRTLFVGAADGSVYRSTDAGESWSFLARLGMGSGIVTLAATATAEGTGLMAGTLDDGVFASADGGLKWNARNSGLTDLSVIALALSPTFEEDRTAFVATGGGLYRTSDGGDSWERAWDSGTGEGVQWVECSPQFSADRAVYMATEGQGVLRSSDGGATWHPLSRGLPDLCVNALALSPEFARDRLIAAATGRGVALSTDGGDSWRVTGAESRMVLSIALSRGSAYASKSSRILLAGLVNEGVIRSQDGGASWEAANQGLEASSLIGLTLSPGLESDSTLFVSGPAEGIFRSNDGGRSRQPSSTGMEAVTVEAVALSPSFPADGTLYAATSAGVFRSQDRGTSWHSLGLRGEPVSLLALSPGYPGDPTLVAASPAALHWSSDGGTGWSPLELPAGDETLTAIALAPGAGGRPHLLAASWSEPSEDRRGRVRVWRRTLPESRWENLFSRESSTRVTILVVPDSFPQDGKFFIGNGESVYRTVPDATERTREGVRPLWLPGPVGSRGYPVISLAATPCFARSRTLLAACGNGVYISREAGSGWQRLGEAPGQRSPIAVAPSPAFAQSGVVYALTLGGRLWRWDPAG